MSGRWSRGLPRRWPVWTALAVVSGLLVVPAASVAAGPVPAAGGSAPVWAYGVVKTASYSGRLSSGAAWTVSETIGFSTILSQSNRSATTENLSFNRTMGVLLAWQICDPNCGRPVFELNDSLHLYETIASASELTTAGTVDENGVDVPALSLVSSATEIHANFTDSESAFFSLLHGGITATNYTSVSVQAALNVAFPTPLGILPTNLSAPGSWNSSAAFTATASAGFSLFHSVKGPHGSRSIGPVTGSLDVPLQGNVSLYGSLPPGQNISLNGTSYAQVMLALAGPFALREGFVLVPRSADLFENDSAAPWAGDQNSTATATLGFLDVRAQNPGHLGIGASGWEYGASDSTPTSAIARTAGPVTAAVGAAAGPSAPGTWLQGEPEPVGTAQDQGSCLVTGVDCAVTGPSGVANVRALVGLVALGIAVAAVVSLGVLITERRRMPPPIYPNASLYPPGAPRAAPPAGRPTPPPSPPPEEEDPLGNLW